ncbi:MAG: UDP-N-acetylmuramate:L-alanyl-gamma-D-glutamyl-meso-diaminopimelate ligase [Deltaproteobacteria bacterium]|nr:UDP-N-acetylmuramate:L-alanyl-gamma-D-glutamyl-meso-diaminopimelate ligase [Deltaproteobacteria bacterium]
MQNGLNRIPETVKSVHFIAICGTAMAALAAALKDMGINVTGSDENVYPPMSTFLEKRKIPVGTGFDPANLDCRPDLVVVGNAVRRENPEAVRVCKDGLCYCSMPQAVNHFLVSGKKAVVVAGTHGKTTTSSIIAWLLYSAGYDPTFMIGGIVKNFDANYRVGKGEYVVLEGDEYDTAFFDKGAKFFHYPPEIAVLTGVEFDHADIFKDLDHVMDTFNRFVTGIGKEKHLIAWDGDENVVRLAAGVSCIVERYGAGAGSCWKMENTYVNPPWNGFDVFCGNRFFGNFKTRLVGGHNRMNTLAAIAVCAHAGLSSDQIGTGLESFSGVRRRQEIRETKKGVVVMDDFAHHPTAVRETVAAVKDFYPDGRLIAVFEPRTNTSMRSVFQEVYPKSFDCADIICIRKPPLLKKVPENERFSSQKLVCDLNSRKKEAHFFPDTDGIISFVAGIARPGDVVLIMSNGGFDNIHERLLTAL